MTIWKIKLYKKELPHNIAIPIQVSTREKWKHLSTLRPVHRCSEQLYLLQPRCGNNSHVHQQVNGQTVVYPSKRTWPSKKKELNTDPRYNMGEPQREDTKWKKPDAEDHIVYDSSYMKCLEKANLQRQKVNTRCWVWEQVCLQMSMMGLRGDRNALKSTFGDV